MSRLRVGFIGTGRKKETPDLTGFFMAYQHGAGYLRQSERCELVACADIVQENAAAFAQAHGIPTTGIYTDYRTMLAEARPDIVSICTWPRLHSPMVIDCARAGVRAIHCEKPMASTWGAALLMAQECDRSGTVLTFNHQRRFGGPFTQAREALLGGAIGDLVRTEVGTVDDMLDDATHWLDYCCYCTGDEPVEWVIGQIDYRTEQRAFGEHGENQTLGLWQYRNGVAGLIATGIGARTIGTLIRLAGTEGTIEIGVHHGPLLRIRQRGSSAWEVIDTHGEGLHDAVYTERAVADLLDALQQGREPVLSARHALGATEIIFAIFESSRRRGRVDLPLTIQDNPLAAMVESGELRPAPRS